MECIKDIQKILLIIFNNNNIQSIFIIEDYYFYIYNKIYENICFNKD